MKTPIKTLACAIATSLAFLSCSTDEGNVDNNIGKNSPCKIKVLAKTCNEERCWEEDVSAYVQAYDHNRVYIEDAVKEWMEEQFATGSNDTGLFVISDLFIHENYFNLLDIDGPEGREYYVDDRRVSLEEYKDSTAKREEYVKEGISRGKRNLPIPAPIYGMSEFPNLNSYTYAGVPMTASEIAELTENYKILFIEFYKEAVNANLGGTAIIPPPIVEKLCGE